MGIEFNHTICWSRDKQTAAAFVADILGLPPPVPFGPFLVLKLANGVSLDFYENPYEDDEKPPFQHYAFLIGDDDFDRVFARIRERGLSYWADPAKKVAGEINHHYGGRGVYFDHPEGHLLEVITTPYGSEMPKG